MDKIQALHNLLNGTASQEEIDLLRQALASGEISVGGNITDSHLIQGSKNISVTNRDGTINIFLSPDKAALLLGKKSDETDAPAAGEPPYMGMRYFDTADADLFFGREALTHDLLARVQEESFLAIVGASGSGKSSVARAGLIPAWKRDNTRRAVQVIIPSAHPLESLAANLTRDLESVTATATLMDDLAKDSRSLRLYVKKSIGNIPFLLLVDQFEETFTLCKDSAERTAFIENLLGLAEEDGAVRVVLTLRADFYHHCAEYEGLRLALEKHQAYIGAMTPDELRDAITEPAQANGWDFQPGLVDLILQDVGVEPGALPLLSHALLETWKRRQGRTLTLHGYHEAGGVRKAITQTAESVYDQFTPAEQAIARNIFLRLTELGEGTQDTRRRVKMEELAQSKEQDAVSKVLKTLTDARLVTNGEDSAEVAHEALIREWGTLRKWLDEDRESLRLHRHLTESAMEWERRKREASELYHGARLKQLQDWVKEHSNALSPLEREFVKASQNVKKRERMGWFAIAGIGVMLLVVIILAMTGQLNLLIYRPIMPEQDWVTIPAGKFLMGSSDEQIARVLETCSGCDFSSEQPQHWVDLPEYKIGKYEVTNDQYNQCIRAGVCPGDIFVGRLNHPVVGTNWYTAKTYCEWAGGRLPTEAEWEKAANWDAETQTKFIYSWGDDIDCSFANYDECGIDDTTEVGSYASGQSPYGLFDMTGNVWEWTSSLYQPYPYNVSDGRENLDSSGERVLRGGSFFVSEYYQRASSRYRNTPDDISFFIGFRCARSPK